MDFLNSPIIMGIAGVVAFFILVIILKAFIKVVPPDKLLVVTGRKKKRDGRVFGFSVERGRTTIVPYFQSVDKLGLQILPINVRVEGVNSANGITVGADATACVCIDDDDESMLYSAVERLMGKGSDEIKDQVQQTLIGNFRGALNKAEPLEAIGMLDESNEEGGDRAYFRNELMKDINSDISTFGMKVVSVSLQKIWDTSNYIANLTQKSLAEKRKEVEIEEARLKAIAEQAESDAKRKMTIAKNIADEKIVASREKLELYKRERTALLEGAKLKADSSIVEAYNKGERKVQELKVKLQELKNESMLLKERADAQAAKILSEGDEEAARKIENGWNTIFSQKVELQSNAGKEVNSILFLQKLPALFESYKKYAKGMKVDNLMMMDGNGFSSAINRGPDSFVQFLKSLDKGFGVDVKRLMEAEGDKA